jgi:hypothetical protein
LWKEAERKRWETEECEEGCENNNTIASFNPKIPEIVFFFFYYFCFSLIFFLGIALRPSDIDVIWIYGYGWPAYRGGPMFWATRELEGGLSRVLEGLKKWEKKFPTSKHFEPSKLLERKVTEEEEKQQQNKNPKSKL